MDHGSKPRDVSRAPESSVQLLGAQISQGATLTLLTLLTQWRLHHANNRRFVGPIHQHSGTLLDFEFRRQMKAAYGSTSKIAIHA